MRISTLANRGRSLEKTIMASTRDALLTQVRGEVVRVKGGKMVQRKGTVDFTGIHLPTKSMLMFDAKQSDNKTRLVTSEDHLPTHQRLEIVRYGTAGAVAGILAESTSLRQFFWLHWFALTAPQPSVRWDHPMMRAVGPTTHAIDWSRVIMEHESASHLTF